MIPKGVHPLTAVQRDSYRTQFRAGTLKRVIATGCWGTGVDFPHLSVVVRADARSGPIDNTQIPGRATRSADGKEFGIVLECDDCHNDTLKSRAARRFTAYRKKGWSVQRIQAPQLA